MNIYELSVFFNLRGGDQMIRVSTIKTPLSLDVMKVKADWFAHELTKRSDYVAIGLEQLNN